ncbi:hypothetical protein BC628DRAFT_1308471, partial [Trametes gibbosa]
MSHALSELDRIESLKESEWNRQRAGVSALWRAIPGIEWVGRFLCRRGIEDAFISVETALRDDPTMGDIWDAKIFKEFLGPDGRPFWDGSSTETRLVFGLAVDGFNPYQSKTAKQKVTSTAIYLICFNIPLHLRYLPENMYLVGVIP